MSYYNKGGNYSGSGSGRGGGNYRGGGGGGGSYRGGRSSYNTGSNSGTSNNEWRGQRNSFGSGSGNRGGGGSGGGGSRYFNNQSSSYETRTKSSFGGNNPNLNADRGYSSRPRQGDYHHNSSYSRGEEGDYGSRDYGRGSPEPPRKRGRPDSSSYNMGSRSNDRSFSGNDSFSKNYYEKNSPSGGGGFVDKSNLRESRSSGGDYQYRKPAGTSFSSQRGGGGLRGSRLRKNGGDEGTDVVRRVVRTVGSAPSRFVGRKRLAGSSYSIHKKLSGRADYLRRLRQMRLQRFSSKDKKKDDEIEDDDDVEEEELEDVEEEEFEEVEEEEEVVEEVEEDEELEKTEIAEGESKSGEAGGDEEKVEVSVTGAATPNEAGENEDSKPQAEASGTGKDSKEEESKEGEKPEVAQPKKKKVIIKKKIIKKVLKKKPKVKEDARSKKDGVDVAESMETDDGGDPSGAGGEEGEKGEADGSTKTKEDAEYNADSTNVAGQSNLSRLKCQHCGFSCVTFNDYSKHLTSKKHLLAMKNASNNIRDTLNNLRSDQRKKQKVLDDQAREANLNLRSFYCNICKLAYRTLKSDHLTSSSHKKMKEYLLPFCRICKLPFKSPWGYEVHLSELAHVKKKSRVDKFRARLGEKVNDVSVDPSSFMVLDAVGSGDDEEDSDIKSEAGDDENTTQKKDGEAGTEDGKDDEKKRKKKKQEIKLGAEHCKLVEVYFCDLCKTYLPLSDDREKSLTVHCRSRFHLERYVRHRDDESLRRRAVRLHREMEKEKEEMRKKKKMSSEGSSPSKKSSADGSSPSKNMSADGSSPSKKGEHSDDKIWSEVDKDLENLLNDDAEVDNKGGKESENTTPAEGESATSQGDSKVPQLEVQDEPSSQPAPSEDKSSSSDSDKGSPTKIAPESEPVVAPAETPADSSLEKK